MVGNQIIPQEGEGSGRAYHAYLLRCWQEEAGGGVLWRFTLVGVGQEHAQKVFASLENLTEFLQEELSLSHPDSDQGR